jgi:hypothetical protein
LPKEKKKALKCPPKEKED